MRRLVMILFLMFSTGVVYAQNTTPEIITFTSELSVVDRNELRSGSVRMFVNWGVVNRPLFTTLVFEQVFSDGRYTNIELPRTTPWVNSVGSGIVALVYPGDDLLTDSLLLRVRLINIFSQETITQRELTIAVIDFSQPQISNFWTDATQISRVELINGTSQILVYWETIGRTDSMNLAFEQVLPGGRLVNVELPRPEPWVNSVGNGIVALVDPGNDVERIELQVRLYVFGTDETIATRSLFLPIGDAASSTPNAPTVHSFAVNPTSATEGDVLTVSWDVSGVTTVQLISSFPNASQPNSNDIVSNRGTQTINTLYGSQQVRFTLRLPFTEFGYDVPPLQTITVPLTCRFTWMSGHTSSEYCPESEPKTAQAFYQAFERGYMVWHVNSISGTTKIVWIYLNEREGFMTAPDFYAGETLSFNETPPAGLYQPINGFGKIWITNNLREQLGWAIASEQTYTMTYQHAGRSLGTRGSRLTVFTLPDGTSVSGMIDSF